MSSLQPSLFAGSTPAVFEPDSLERSLAEFCWNGRETLQERVTFDYGGQSLSVNSFVNEFWTSRQRAAHSLHEVSYRACFKPQLPRFFIERLTRIGDVVYDPFMGRGTTLLEAALLERIPAGCDVNPLSQVLVGPRLAPPTIEAVEARLREICWTSADECAEKLLTFYHPETLRELCALRTHLLNSSLDDVDRWIQMVAVNRLTGHSSGFFSVYTLPPNQAVSLAAQSKINAARNQVPTRRDVPRLILAKSRSLLSDCDERTIQVIRGAGGRRQLITSTASHTPSLPSSSVSLVVTSPPFLDVVDYAGDNWLRGWFCGIDSAGVSLTVVKKIDEWRAAMTLVFAELARVLVPGGHVAFEVGEVRGGKVRLEEHVLPCGVAAGLEPRLVVINSQQFTKTAACWGVQNNRKGTNTNRIVVFRKLG